ncbi:endoribonuclease L-PSP [Blastomyces dermatitidis ATCC 18188]|uniref:Endoribonuclease L-PSP n=1 Tax=Ajellomyces dermatitidis (strain ATCC 18188 / CBS 674.68) TaxID=653446 RepID=F2TP70_AJEDA|nr:endoribonuclease L-PSP [Blastomyces dermatitidis ATCC 18188]
MLTRHIKNQIIRISPFCSPRLYCQFPSTLSIAPRIATSQFRRMSDIVQVFAKDACPPAGPYSHAIKANGQVFLSGAIPADENGNLIEGSVGEKTALCCKNIAAVLAAAGTTVERVVKVNVFLTDMKDFAEMNAEYEKFFTHKPARSCVAVHQLPKGVPVEIECIALQ